MKLVTYAHPTNSQDELKFDMNQFQIVSRTFFLFFRVSVIESLFFSNFQ